MTDEKENITIRIDAEIAEQAEALFKSLGMDLSTATSLFYEEALQYGGFPFEIKLGK